MPLKARGVGTVGVAVVGVNFSPKSKASFTLNLLPYFKAIMFKAFSSAALSSSRNFGSE